MTDIFDTLAANDNMIKLTRAIKVAGMDAKLQGAESFTLFAPDDNAFVRMDIEKEIEDPDKLRSILAYHLVSGKHSAAEIRNMEELETTAGKKLTITLDEGEVVVDNGKFVRTDIECSNGIIHIVDNVFKPNLSGWYRDE